MARQVIDPLTRIEGILRFEVEVNDGVVTDAWVSGGLYRGLEKILLDRRPSDAFYVVQRICGVCPISHGHSSSMGTEAALGITIPNNARVIRNLIEAAQFLHSHILWFYILAALDYVDPVKALTANIADTYSLAQAAGTGTSDFGAVAKRLQAFVDNGQLSIFTNGWFGHPAYPQDMPAELHLIGVAHYLEALEMQAVAAEIIAVLGGKFPHFMTSLPGGTAFVPTENKLDDILFRFLKLNDWITNTMIPDTLAIAPFYADMFGHGGGHGNFLSWGVFSDESLERGNRYLPDGAIRVAEGLTVADSNWDAVTEEVGRAWYDSESGLHPSKGVTDGMFDEYNTDAKYSWGKAPLYDGLHMEAGPLSRMLVAYLRGVKPVQDIVNGALGALGAAGKPEILVSTLGRVAARNLEAKVISDWSLEWVNELIGAVAGGDSSYFEPHDVGAGEGVGLWEAPRGALSHFINIEGGKIARYQVVTPSTWNCGPRDDSGVRGVMEEALVGTPIIDPERPLEACRVARSFDP